MKKMMLFVVTTILLNMPCGAFSQELAAVIMTENTGTISDISPNTLAIQSETSTVPTHYTYTKKTTYVDERGMPVTMETVRSGLPVTVYYTSQGNQMIADKVVVRNTTMSTTENPLTEEKQTTTTTTTTTETK